MSSDDLGDDVRSVLAAHVVDDPDAPDNNFSLWEPEDDADRRGITELSRLYVGYPVALRTRGRHRLVEALVAHLSAHVWSDDADLLPVHSVAFTRGDEAIMLSAHRASKDEPVLARHGWCRVDGPLAYLAWDTADLVVPEVPLTIDAAALARLAEERSHPRERQASPPGRYRVVGWGLDHVQVDEDDRASLGALVGRAVATVAARDRRADAVAVVADLLRSAAVMPGGDLAKHPVVAGPK